MKGFKNLKLFLTATSKKAKDEVGDEEEDEPAAEAEAEAEEGQTEASGKNIDSENEEKSQLKGETRQNEVSKQQDEEEEEEEERDADETTSFDFSKREIRKYSQKFPPKPLDKLTVLDYYGSNSPVFAVEFRPNKKRSDGEWICAHKLHPEEHWTSVKRVDLDAKVLRTLRENPDMEKGRLPDVYKVMNEGVFYIGIDALRGSCVVTDRNPHLEGLVDVHRCVYLPSSFEKNQTLPGYLTQNILYLELPNASLHAPGVAPGLFFVTPRLVGCNIFIAHDPGLHKFWVLRISGKDPHRPPDLRLDRKSAAVKKKRPISANAPTSTETGFLAPKTSEIASKSPFINSKANRRAGRLSRSTRGRLIRPSLEHRLDSLAKTPLKTNTGLVAVNTEEKTTIKEDNNKTGVEEAKVGDWAASNDLLSLKRRYNRPADPLELFGAKNYHQVPWRPSTPVREAREKEIEAGRKPKTWAQYFREYRGYADCVLDVLRLRGVNASFVIRVATDRHWVTDVRDQKFWLEGVNKSNKCSHFMYRGEGVFYGVQQNGTWKFGLKDLHSTFSRNGVMHQFPLEDAVEVIKAEGKKKEKDEEGSSSSFRIPEEDDLDEINRENNRKKTIKAGRRATILAAATKGLFANKAKGQAAKVSSDEEAAEIIHEEEINDEDGDKSKPPEEK